MTIQIYFGEWWGIVPKKVGSYCYPTNNLVYTWLWFHVVIWRH